MVDQREEKGQIVRVHPLFINGQDEAASRCFDQIVAVFDTLGNALDRHEFTSAKGTDKVGHVLRRNMGVDGHRVRRSSDGKGQGVQSLGPAP